MLKRSVLFLYLLLLYMDISFPALAVTPCAPKIVGRTIVSAQPTIATISYKGSLFRLVQVIGDKQSLPFFAIYREQGNRCWVSYADPGGDSYSMAEGVPRPVAITFAKKFIQGRLQKFGVAQTVAWYSKQKKLAPEDAAALAELKIEMPKGIAVAPWPKLIEPEQQIK
jgi:hypothetical protein